MTSDVFQPERRYGRERALNLANQFQRGPFPNGLATRSSPRCAIKHLSGGRMLHRASGLVISGSGFPKTLIRVGGGHGNRLFDESMLRNTAEQNLPCNTQISGRLRLVPVEPF